MDLTRDAEQATRRARLGETLLLDGVAARAIAAQNLADPKGPPTAVVVWVKDGAGTIADQTYRGRVGELALVPVSVAEVLKDAAYVEVRESLTVPAWQKPEIAEELHAIAGELLAAAAAFLPTAKPQPAEPASTAAEDV